MGKLIKGKLKNEQYLCTLDTNHRIFEISRITAYFNDLASQFKPNTKMGKHLRETYGKDIVGGMFNKWLKEIHED